MTNTNLKTGLFFGSYNPIHIGHLIIANFMATRSDLDEVWLVVSPHNPLKSKSSLANDYDRLHLVHLATEDNDLLKASNIEFKLPQPSYTIDTLTYLKEEHPGREFVLIMGADNLATLHKWKNYELLLRNYPIYVYDRDDYGEKTFPDFPEADIRFFKAPLLQLSATYIRDCLKNGLSVRYMVPEPVFQYLLDNPIYK
jgi:nicotinate-nucleotide adenylyltransferase